jgi:DNA mismatch endonuclease (patch repair protein)
MDKIAPERRSANMAKVRGKDTGPEMRVRRLAHRMGLRFRLHRKDLPGRPDLVFPGRGLVVFVHGCFWHRHEGCRRATTPSTRQEFWQAKFDANVQRDKRQIRDLEALGWRVLVIWECELKDEATIESELRRAAFGAPADAVI